MAKRRGRQTASTNQWHLMDLHLHTPASSDYQEEGVDYLDILKRCEDRGLEIIAFTDHNTVAGYRRVEEELKKLGLLEELKRLDKDEELRLAEYRRLLGKILLLRGFEFTATFGFHILALFSPERDLRELEHLLLNLHIPNEVLDSGSSTIGASTDVSTAYRMINEAGGLVIAAHANSSNGVAMRGFPLGGQTKIAYTQDPHLHALEVTDLALKGNRGTAIFFSGRKPEYPRRMHCIQGSDAHRLFADPKNSKNLGIGDRATEVMIPNVSFEALMELFSSQDFARTRPKWTAAENAFDFVQQALDEGANIIQEFHESMTLRGGRLYAVIADICAFANTNGGSLYIGLSSDPAVPVVGVSNTAEARRKLEDEISKRISPVLNCQIDTHKTKGKTILRVLVPSGDDPPYAVDDNKIYVRAEGETGLAVRDEIVTLVRQGLKSAVASAAAEKPAAAAETTARVHKPVVTQDDTGIQPPRTGVEVAEVEERGGVLYYTMRDLRNGSTVKNVTISSARRLWHYAISQYRSLPVGLKNAKVTWKGDLGLIAVQRRGKQIRYDLAQKTGNGVRLYFGVTDDGIHGEWKELVGEGVE